MLRKIRGFFAKKPLNTLILGESLIYGLNFKWMSQPDRDARTQKGLWISDPLTSILKFGNALGSGTTAMDVALESLRYGNFRLKAQNRDGDSVDWPRNIFSQLGELPSKSLIVPPIPVSPTSIGLSDQIQKTKTELERNIQTEIVWRSEFSKINDEAPIWNQPEAQAMVQRICDVIHVVHGGPVELAPRCRIFASLTPNAFAYPGGDIFVSAGLLGVLPNVDTLIFFLAHEYSHIYARHSSKRMSQQDFNGRFLVTASLITNILAFGASEQISLIAKALGTNNIGIDTINTALKSSIVSHTRDQENEADEMGIEMAMNLSAHPGAILEGLRALEKYLDETFKKQERSTLEQLTEADHDSLSERISKIEKRALEYSQVHQSREPLARTLDESYWGVYKVMKPLSNYYRLSL